MRNTILNRLINFVRNIDPKVWFTVAVACTLAFAILMLSTGIFNFSEEVKRDRDAQQKVYAEAIEEVKRDCDMVEKIIRPKSVTYTYSCDGVEYQFDEWL